MTTPYLCFLYVSYILCINHIAAVFCLILTLVGQRTHSTQNMKLYMNVISRQNIHTFIIYLASLLVILTVIWPRGSDWLGWVMNSSCKSKLILFSDNWRKQWAILIVIYNSKIVRNKTNKIFRIFRSEIMFIKSWYNNSLGKNVNSVIKRLVD